MFRRRPIYFLGVGVPVSVIIYLLLPPASPALLPVDGSVRSRRATDAVSHATYGRVWLYPDREKGNLALSVSVGELGRDGRYSVFTDGRRGAPPGWYKVCVLALEQHEKGRSKKASQTLLTEDKYAEVSTSGLALEVVPNASVGSYDILLR